jgi:glycosyltransferase involved in cell wall biosynthesis
VKINLVYNRIPHHSLHSGYDQLARYLSDQLFTESLESEGPRLVPWKAWQWMTENSGELISYWSGMKWYEMWSLMLELSAARSAIKGTGEIYHILYGENSFRYLGILSPVFRRRGSRIVASYHQPPEVFDQVVRRKQTLKSLDAIIAVSQSQVDYFSSLVGAQKVFVVPHGIDTDFFVPAEKPATDHKVGIFVGEWLRDFTMLRTAVERLVAVPDLQFKIITNKEKASLFSGLRNAEVIAGISEAELLGAYQEADFMLLPLTDCTANNALLEGMACGLPIVTTDVGGVRDYVDEKCAFIIAPGDVDGLCSAVNTLVSDEVARSEMGTQSRQRALALDWRHVAARFVEVYLSLMN